MGDIEKFFNDNFFKKVNSEPAEDLQIKRDFEEERKEFMHGVPESAYEPTVMPENDNEKQHMGYKANDPFRAAVRRKAVGKACELGAHHFLFLFCCCGGCLLWGC